MPGKNTRMSPGVRFSNLETAKAEATGQVCSFGLASWIISTGNNRPSLATIGQPPRYAEMRSVANVADMTISRKSGRTFCCTRRAMPSARSLSRPRSWNSSKIRVPTDSKNGSSCNMRSKMPGVTTTMRSTWPASFVEADLIADLAAKFRAALEGHAPSRRPRRQPPWLENHDPPILGQRRIENRRRHPRRLAGPRWRFQDDRRMRAQSRQQFGKNLVDGKGRKAQRSILKHADGFFGSS